MRFRYKVIMINIAFLSMALGTLGCIMIYHNFRQSVNIQTTYGIEENNILQSSIEYRLLNVINQHKGDLSGDFANAAKEAASQVLSNRTSLYILYDNTLIFNSDQNTEEHDIPSKPTIPSSLLSSLELGGKKYIIQKEAKDYFLYVASKNIIDDKDLYIVTKRNANDTYKLLYRQISYYIAAMISLLSLCAIFLYLICKKLTQPMEELNAITDKIARGDYNTLARVHSDDEIGMLAEKFNQMTLAVSEHIQELNTMVKQHEQFVADFTHEIKTPMTTIIGYADTLRSKEMNPERRQLAYQYIYSEGKRLETMSMKLFDLIYLKEHEIARSAINTTVLADEIKTSMQPILDRKDIRLETNVLDITIYGEPELLKTVFINLIDNARKASPSGSTIYLNGFMKEDIYCLEVTDHGCGMDEETLNHICDEFFMADKSRTRAEGGAGLGMSLVSLIIHRHNATMNIQSALNEGTTVTIHFSIYSQE